MNNLKKSDYLKKYLELKIIGRGGFGSVYLIEEKANKTFWVSKKISLSNLKNEEEKTSAVLEANVLKTLCNKHIVKYKESFIEREELIIIMEYCEKGDLSKLIKTCKKHQKAIIEEKIKKLFIQLLFGLKYVHKLKILHRDLKTNNIFLNAKGIVKIGDFGISKILKDTGEKAQTFVGTPYYLSPEICKNEPYSFKSDIWSLGCILYELCCLKHAFFSTNLIGLAKKIEFEEPEPIPNFYSQELKILINALLCKNRDLRPSIEQIFEFRFVQSYLEEIFLLDRKTFILKNEDENITPKQKLMKKKIEASIKREKELVDYLISNRNTNKNPQKDNEITKSNFKRIMSIEDRKILKKQISEREDFIPFTNGNEEDDYFATNKEPVKKSKNQDDKKYHQYEEKTINSGWIGGDECLGDTVNSQVFQNDNFCGNTVNSEFEIKSSKNFQNSFQNKKIVFKIEENSDEENYPNESQSEIESQESSFEEIETNIKKPNTNNFSKISSNFLNDKMKLEFEKKLGKKLSNEIFLFINEIKKKNGKFENFQNTFISKFGKENLSSFLEIKRYINKYNC